MRKHFKRIILLLMVFVVGITLTSCGRTTPKPLDPTLADPADYVWPEDPKHVYSLKVANGINAATPSGEALLKIKEVLEEESNGAVTLDIFWESTLGGTTEVSEGVRIGSIDIGLMSSAIVSNYTRSIDVYSLPFIIENRDHFKAATEAISEQIIEDVQDDLGTPLGFWESGYRHLCTKDKRVGVLEDCKGLTIRVMDGQVYAESFKALGAIPSNIALTELVPALQQGTIDGVEEPAAIVANQQQYSFCKYLTMIGYNYSILVPILSNQTVKDYPPEVIALVERVFDEYKFYATDAGQKYEDAFLKTCSDAGMEIIYLPDDELQRFRDAVAPIWDKYASEIGEDLIETVTNVEY